MGPNQGCWSLLWGCYQRRPLDNDHHVASQRLAHRLHQPRVRRLVPNHRPDLCLVRYNGPVIRVTSTVERLYATSPSVDAAGVVDVSVRFTAGEAVNMTLADAFTFYESTTLPGTGPGGSTSPTTTQAPSTGSGGGSNAPKTPIAERGTQKLWPPSASSPLSRLSTNRWPSTSCGSSCTASIL